MTQYEERVEYQKELLEAEDWAKTFKCLHRHSLNSMWYDTRPQDTEGGKHVTDIQYNNGLIKRILSDGTEVFFGEELKGRDLVDQYRKHR
tara:strand:+ start:319 stop:588 length:270 start_codon:yes stop_codon:yes gene_type:complete